MTRDTTMNESGSLSEESVFSLHPNERVRIGDRVGRVDRIDSSGVVYVTFGEKRKEDGALVVEEHSAESVERA